jgi:hypothetical protein
MAGSAPLLFSFLSDFFSQKGIQLKFNLFLDNTSILQEMFYLSANVQVACHPARVVPVHLPEVTPECKTGISHHSLQD